MGEKRKNAPKSYDFLSILHEQRARSSESGEKENKGGSCRVGTKKMHGAPTDKKRENQN